MHIGRWFLPLDSLGGGDSRESGPFLGSARVSVMLSASSMFMFDLAFKIGLAETSLVADISVAETVAVHSDVS